MKWNHPFFAQSQARFDLGLPPENNANFAFVLTALDKTEKAVFILPNSVLSTEDKNEAIIKKNLVDNNILEAVIELPENMFESTGIPTFILIFNKEKTHYRVQMINLKEKAMEKVREQRGQYGKTNTQRVYHKKMNVLPEETISEVLSVIENRKNEVGFTKSVSVEDVKKENYMLSPRRYVENEDREEIHRSYEEIIRDLNRVIKNKNGVKITVNETIAKDLGVYDLAKDFERSKKTNAEMNEMLKIISPDLKINKEDIVSLSRYKEMKFEVKDFDRMPEIIALFINMWKQYVMTMNSEENRLLVELRDALLPDLMSGKSNYKN